MSNRSAAEAAIRSRSSPTRPVSLIPKCRLWRARWIFQKVGGGDAPKSASFDSTTKQRRWRANLTALSRQVFHPSLGHHPVIAGHRQV